MTEAQLIQQFIGLQVAKYAVISTLAYYNFPMATNLADQPRMFNTDLNVYTIISLRDPDIPGLISYVCSRGFGVEFEFTEGTGRVTLLTYQQIVNLLDLYDPELIDPEPELG